MPSPLLGLWPRLYNKKLDVYASSGDLVFVSTSFTLQSLVDLAMRVTDLLRRDYFGVALRCFFKPLLVCKSKLFQPAEGRLDPASID